LIIPFLHSVGLIYTVVFGVFAVTRFFIPAKMAILPCLVKHHELYLVNSLSTTSMMIAFILSFLIGGLIIDLLGVSTCFFVDSGTYILSAVAISMISIGETGKKKEKFSLFIKELWIGINSLKRKGVRLAILSLSILMIGVGVLLVLAVISLINRGIEMKGIGILGALLGLGMFLGTVLVGKFGHRVKINHLITLVFIILGISIILFANCKIFLLIAPLSFIGGLSIPIIIIYGNTSLHRYIPNEIWGRAFSSLEIIINLSLLLGVLFASPLANAFGEVLVLEGLGGLFLIFAIIVFIQPHIRQWLN
ncbi:MAG: MFS transporter, partial [bacterium]|nr:MFS transporter [bacterium]